MLLRGLAIGLVLIATFGAKNAGAQVRTMIYADVTVDADPATAFADWTSKDGIEDFFAPLATIEAEPGGLYELCFDVSAVETQQCGNDDGRILSLQPGQMLSFTWAMPPYMSEIRPHLTVVQILFEPMGDDRTHVHLFHTGFGTGEAWDEGHAYFDRVWPQVLENYRVSKLTDQP
ncbi:SRPBCC domain-containing protein [Algimonas porphyrae]|uniref:Activator of Hsp90 ATPase homologue 1/2-like C-terminal domain-containing protein n=1 Tax=Algimonas porphyrae TaxID=1128113 RepID=A0ABQ5UVP2_9PROT|nr:SRPBCC domain-containing protein [Algimonas porphyrae]GLQ19346.1 hypothetical protein GCM10007854_03010 [Algimonas porphyrae]